MSHEMSVIKVRELCKCETCEEMNDEIKIVNLYGNGISDPHFVLHVQHLIFHDTKSL